METKRAQRKTGTALALATLQLSACLGGAPVEPNLGEADLRVLFVGNSLTSANGLPLMVQTIAEAAGHTFAALEITANNSSLEDHWYSGVAQYIRDLEPDVVVMQQGPSSLPESQVHLREWTATLDAVVKEVGGRSALFMVWPEDARRFTAFDDVRQSYSDAAEAVDGIFIPAGEAWREMWELDPAAPLYGFDGFHPSYLGSVVAALTIYRMLFDETVTGLPPALSPTTAGLPTVVLEPDEATRAQQAVEAAVEQWGRR
jgi:hypothetical protein